MASSEAHTVVLESAPIVGSALPGGDVHSRGKKEDEKNLAVLQDDATVHDAALYLDGEQEPTEEEYNTLRKIAAPMKWHAVLLCSVELVERASYFGVNQLFSNFVRGPLPEGGNGAGAVAPGDAGLNQSSGALGMGSVAASAVTSTFTFLAYLIPIFTAVWTDTKLGKFKAICIGTVVGMIGHFLLVIPAVPSIIQSGKAFGPFFVFLIILSFAAGMIKPALGPLLCDQSPVKRPVIQTTKKGERVILDPQTSVNYYLNVMYMCINIGGLFAIATSYAERLVGFWLAFLVPGILYALTPIALIAIHKRLYQAPPQGSVVMESFAVFKVLIKRAGFFRLFKGGDELWKHAKPSYMEQTYGEIDRSVVTWDDTFVEEIRQSISACAVFFITPVFLLADGGIGSMLNSQSASMTLSGIPNDIMNNFNSLTIIIATPIITYGVYPFFARIGYPLKPMTRLSIGFMLGCINMIIGAIIQARIYKLSPCGEYASTCDEPAPVSIAWQICFYAIPGIGEIFVMVTGYELAYTRAPARMKSLVYAICLFSSAISAAISLACSNAIQDPYLVWPYVALAIACFICAVIFPVFFRHLNETTRVFADPTRQAGALELTDGEKKLATGEKQ